MLKKNKKQKLHEKTKKDFNWKAYFFTRFSISMQKHGFLSHMGRYLKYNKNTLTLRINLQLQQRSHRSSSGINVECSKSERLV